MHNKYWLFFHKSHLTWKLNLSFCIDEWYFNITELLHFIVLQNPTSFKLMFCSKIVIYFLFQLAFLLPSITLTKILTSLKSGFLLLRILEVKALGKNLTTHESFAVSFNRAQIAPMEFNGVMKFRSTGSTPFNGSKRLKRSYTGWR